MSGKNNKTFYAYVWDDLEIFYDFSISPINKVLLDQEVETLLEKLIFFHKEYQVISKKYQILEFFSEEYLNQIGIKQESLFIGLEEELLFRGVRFFPFYNSIKNSHSASHVSKVFYQDKESGNVQSGYVYGLYNTLNDGLGLCDLDYLKENVNVPEKLMDVIMSEDSLLIEDEFSKSIGFSIGINNNIFLPYYEGLYLDGRIDDFKEGNLIDNREMAFLNAPRFNSFLRELKKVFVDVCNWNFEFQPITPAIELMKYMNEDGVLLDNRIIYQEDVEAGYVDIEKYKWIGPASITPTE